MGRKKLGMFRMRFKFIDRVLLIGMSFLVIITKVIFMHYTNVVEQHQIDYVQMMMEKSCFNQREQFKAFVDDKVAILSALVTYPQIYEMNLEEQTEFLSLRSENFGFRHIFVMDMKGNGYYIEEGLIRNQYNEKFFMDVKNNDVYITEPYYSDDGLQAIITVCVSVYDKSDTKVGVLCGAVNLSTIQDVITRDEMLLEGDCFGLDREGNFVTNPNSGNIDGGISIFDRKNSEVSLIQQAFLWEDSRGGTIVLDGREFLAYACYLPDYTWTIVQCTPMDEVVKQYNNLTILQSVLFVSVVVLIGCVIRIIYCWNKSINESYRDSLTLCNNRAACIKMLAYLEGNTSEDVTIVFMDLNKFKFVNDTYGHDKGDVLLKIFSRALSETFGKIGFVCRIGGDEFVTILLDSSEEKVKETWQRLCERLKEENEKLDFDYTIASSYGYATRKKGETGSLEELMQLADERMYECKQVSKEK